MLRKWTFMVYMAGDNGRIFKDGTQLMDNLESYGWADIRDMSSVGSTENVAIVTQYDTLNAHKTPRLYIDGKSEKGTVVDTVPPVNTGDPKNLTDFIVWAEEAYPAEKYALVLWNHGTGWKEDDIYARHRETEEITKRDHRVRAVRSRKKMLNQAFFLSTAAEIMRVEDDETRAICYDDTSMDFLDNQGLVKALAEAEKHTGRHLALLGMDACLMSMIEVAYEIREQADFMVGSQEIEAGTGWPYASILQGLLDSPDISCRNLSKLIVDEFGKYYLSRGRNCGGKNTQSAIDLSAVTDSFEHLRRLAEAVASHYEDIYIERTINRIRHRVQRFTDKDYSDLRHLMQLFHNEYAGKLKVDEVASQLDEHLSVGATGSPIVANFAGASRPNAHGLSIYLPTSGCSPFYNKQALARSGWYRVIQHANQIDPPVLRITAVNQEKTRAAASDIHSITCPICGGVIEVPDNIAEIGETVVTKGVRDRMEQIIAAIQHALSSPAAQARQWIDLPCPHCSHTFQYDAKTKETRR
jgi:hypothetical protein